VKTTRIRKKIKEYLNGNPRSTSEIMEYINNVSRHGTTSQQLGNVLSKDPEIVKVGYVQRAGVRYGAYKVCQWALKADAGVEERPRRDTMGNRIEVPQSIHTFHQR
jgi:hypothetical protein